MNHSEELRQQLHSINRKSYPAYKSLKGVYQFGNYLLSIDHVQGDPFASPSHVSVQISHKMPDFPKNITKILSPGQLSVIISHVSLKSRSIISVSAPKAPAKAD